jgi:hypothetical protein
MYKVIDKATNKVVFQSIFISEVFLYVLKNGIGNMGDCGLSILAKGKDGEQFYII